MKAIEYYEYQKLVGKSHFEKILIGEAKFHQFGVDYEEFENGPGNYSTAIIELKDGSIKNVPVELIKFIEPN